MLKYRPATLLFREKVSECESFRRFFFCFYPIESHRDLLVSAWTVFFNSLLAHSTRTPPTIDFWISGPFPPYDSHPLFYRTCALQYGIQYVPFFTYKTYKSVTEYRTYAGSLLCVVARCVGCIEKRGVVLYRQRDHFCSECNFAAHYFSSVKGHLVNMCVRVEAPVILFLYLFFN